MLKGKGQAIDETFNDVRKHVKEAAHR